MAILFVDVVGSTSMAAAADPELLREVLARYFDLASEAIWTNGGTVEKFIGDAVMAVFGVPASTSDDGVRAVRAGLDVVDAVETLAKEFSDKLHRHFAVRVGINVGEVFVSTNPDGEFSVTGEAVNVAERLQAQADPGHVLVSESVASLPCPGIDFVPGGTMVPRGSLDRITYYAAVRATVTHDELPLVGRDGEMDLLSRLARRCADQQSSYALTLVADAGAGKTRLLTEFAARSRLQSITVSVSAHDKSELGPIVNLVKGCHGLLAHSGPGHTHEDLTARDARFRAVEGDLGISTSADDLGWAVRDALMEIVSKGPVLVIWDDLQYATGPQASRVQEIQQATQGMAIFHVALTRPQLFELLPSWGGGRGSRVEELAPLEDAAMTVVAQICAPPERRAPEQVERIVRASGGNPLLGQILARHWAIDEGLPPGARLMFAAVVEQLRPDERAVYDALAVAGSALGPSEIAAMTDTSAQRVAEALGSLRRQRLIGVENSPGGHERSYRVAGELVGRVGYEMLPLRQRADLHVLAARVLEGREDERWDIERLAHLDASLALASSGLEWDHPIDSIASTAAALRRSRVEVLISRGDAHAPGALAELITSLDDDDDLVVAVALSLALPDVSDSTVGDIATMVEGKVDDAERWTRLAPHIHTLSSLRRREVVATDLLESSGVVEGIASDDGLPAGDRLIALVWLGQVLSESRAYASCHAVAREGIALSERCGVPTLRRMFELLALQVKFIVPVDFGDTYSSGRAVLASVVGNARLAARVHAVLAATAAYQADAQKAGDHWRAVVDSPLQLEGDELVIARQYNALRLELCEGPVAGAEEWLSMARSVTESEARISFYVCASDAFVRAGDIRRARGARERCMSEAAAASTSDRFLFLDAVEAACAGAATAADALLDRDDAAGAVMIGSVSRVWALFHRALCHQITGRVDSARQMCQQARVEALELQATGVVSCLGRLEEIGAALVEDEVATGGHGSRGPRGRKSRMD